jgi:hypothetical protein
LLQDKQHQKPKIKTKTICYQTSSPKVLLPILQLILHQQSERLAGPNQPKIVGR